MLLVQMPGSMYGAPITHRLLDRLIVRSSSVPSHRWLATIFLLIGWMVAAPHGSSAQITSPGYTEPEDFIDSGFVVDVRFEGNDHITDYELSTIVNTRVASPWQRFLNSIIPSLGVPPQYADRVTLDGDVESIVQYYKDNGFMEAEAAWQQRFHQPDKEAYIRVMNQNRTAPREYRQRLPRVRDTIIFWISEGPVYTISRVAFLGLEELPEEFQPELTERNTIRVGDRWSLRNANAEIVRLQKIMEENGYPFFREDDMTVQVLPQLKKVRVLNYISPGPRYKFGPIRIEYDSATQHRGQISDRVILGQLTFKQGEWYRESLVRESEQYLYRLGPLEQVRIVLDTAQHSTIPPDQRDSLEVPLVIRLRMKITQELRAGAYSGWGNEIGFTLGATAEYMHRNFFGGAQALDIDGLWQFLPAYQKLRSATADLTIPYIGWRHIPLIIGAKFITTRQENKVTHALQYISDNYQLGVRSNIIIGHPDDRTNVSPELTAEYVERQEGEDEVPIRQVNAIFGVFGQWDQSNDLLNPTRGFILNGGMEFGLPWLRDFAPEGFSSASYWKRVGQFRFYEDFNTGGALVVAQKVRGGDIRLWDPTDPLRELPLERRFFGGGASSIRGWGSKELLISNDPDRRTYHGGFRQLEISVEGRIAPIKERIEAGDVEKFLSPLRVALFADAGNVWDHDIAWSKLAINQIAFTAGIGLRYNFFLGALRLDWGFKLYDPNPALKYNEFKAAPPDTRGRWIWGRKLFKDDVYSLHFGLGQAF